MDPDSDAFTDILGVLCSESFKPLKIGDKDPFAASDERGAT